MSKSKIFVIGAALGAAAVYLASPILKAKNKKISKKAELVDSVKENIEKIEKSVDDLKEKAEDFVEETAKELKKSKKSDE